MYDDELADAAGEPAVRAAWRSSSRTTSISGRSLPADSDVEEVVRNFFIRQPSLWFD